jgi:hypothetical protein
MHNDFLIICNSEYNYGDETKEDEMGEACNTHGKDQKYKGDSLFVVETRETPSKVIPL